MATKKKKSKSTEVTTPPRPPDPSQSEAGDATPEQAVNETITAHAEHLAKVILQCTNTQDPKHVFGIVQNLEASKRPVIIRQAVKQAMHPNWKEVFGDLIDQLSPEEAMAALMLFGSFWHLGYVRGLETGAASNVQKAG